MVSCRKLSRRSENSWTALATFHEMLECHTQRAMFHHLPPNGETLLVVDGNATLHAMQQVQCNFLQICKNKVYDMTPSHIDFLFSTDMYGSLKTMERKKQGCGNKIILKGESIKWPADWKAFLSNDGNKQQFIKLRLEVWSKDSFATQTQGKECCRSFLR